MVNLKLKLYASLVANWWKKKKIQPQGETKALPLPIELLVRKFMGCKALKNFLRKLHFLFFLAITIFIKH